MDGGGMVECDGWIQRSWNMDYSFKIVPREGYLHIRVTGDNTPEVVGRYLQEVYQSCLKSGCPNILIEENLVGAGMSLTEIFEVVKERSGQVWPVVQRVAFVDANPKHDPKNMKFAETAAANRSICMSVFASVPDAEAWLVREVKKPSP
jgi:hypothetical protein